MVCQQIGLKGLRKMFRSGTLRAMSTLPDMKDDVVSPVAARVIEKCGGVQIVCDITGRSESWVRKWTYPRSRNGRGGWVPMEDAQALLHESMKTTPRVRLSAWDFFERLTDAPPVRRSVSPRAARG